MNRRIFLEKNSAPALQEEIDGLVLVLMTFWVLDISWCSPKGYYILLPREAHCSAQAQTS